MKYILLVVLSMVAVSAVNAQESTEKKQKKEKTEKTDKTDKSDKSESKSESKSKSKKSTGLTFKTVEIVRENIPYGTDDMFIFEFKNDSKTPAIIQGVQTSCGCTTAQKPEEPVAKGKKSQIVVKYDTKRVGNFTKTITITSNVSEPIILTIKGSVLPQEATTEN